MRDDLIGFLMGALEAPEREQIEKRLERDPTLREHLKLVEQSLEPLSGEDWQYDSPTGLAERTCTFVEESIAAGITSVDQLAPQPASRFPVEALGGSSSSWSMADVFVAAGIFLAAAMLFFPAIVNSRYHAQLNSCQNNLRHLGGALFRYSELNKNHFPVVPAAGNRSGAGIYAPKLMQANLVNNKRFFICPASIKDGNKLVVRIPSLKQIDKARGLQLVRMQRNMGGSYAYTLGFTRKGKLRGVKNQGRKHYVLLADAPQKGPGGVTVRFHLRGQNVFFEDGHAAYLATRKTPGRNDDFYANDQGLPWAGLHVNDSVVGNSASPPILSVKAEPESSDSFLID